MSGAPGGWPASLREELESSLAGFRTGIRERLEGLSEEEARRSLVPSRTTLLGLVKHLTFVERVWFDQAVTGRSLAEIGVAATPDRSFVLRRDDTIASVSAAHEEACEHSRTTAAGLAMDDRVEGRGGHDVWWLHLQVLRELAQHTGHADILREQVLAARPS